MTQLHKRFSAEQVKVLLKRYEQGTLTRIEIQEMLEVGKTRFFAVLVSEKLLSPPGEYIIGCLPLTSTDRSLLEGDSPNAS